MNGEISLHLIEHRFIHFERKEQMRINQKRNQCQFILLFIFIFILLFYSLTKCSNENEIKRIKSKYYSDCPSIDSQGNLFDIYSRIINDSNWLMKSFQSSPTFDQLHQSIYGLSTQNIYSNWTNIYQMKIDLSYPYTSLNQFLFKQILKKINIQIKFVVEVGSFKGKSTINLINTLSKRNEFVMLCIDTWLGSIEHWNNNEQRKLMEIRNGRP